MVKSAGFENAEQTKKSVPKTESQSGTQQLDKMPQSERTPHSQGLSDTPSNKNERDATVEKIKPLSPEAAQKHEILVASSVKNPKVPTPNTQGTVGSVPLEKVHPADLRRAPSRKPNKFDTSITGPGILDELNSFQKEDLKSKLEAENPATLFPWRTVAEFHSSGKGSPNTANAKVIKAYILENFYNDWYANVSIVIGTCFISWLFAYWGFSWWSLGLVFLGTSSVYSAEFRRFNRNIRDDLKRTTVEETISGKVETTLWLNSFLSKFWVIYMPVLSQQVKDQVNPILAGVAPGYGIDALSLDEFTLGSKAPAIRGIKSYTKTGKNSIEMDWSFAFTPNDESDMTPTEVKEKVNPKISLGVTLGKSFLSKTLPVLVEDINVAGKMRIRLEFGRIFPNIKMVSVQLLEPPLIDFVLKPLGGDTLGLDVMSFLPGLKSLVKTIINSNVGPMLYAPNHMDIDVEQIMAAQENDAIGCLVVTVTSADGLKGSDFITNTVDPYVVISLEKNLPSEDKQKRTSIKSDNKNPRWNETRYLLLPSLNQTLTLSCFDYNDVRRDTLIGDISIDLNTFLQEPVQDNLTSELMVGAKSRGLLNYSLRWVPVVQPADASKSSEESSGSEEVELVDDTDDFEDSSESDVGILKFTLQKVKSLNTATSMTGNLSPCASLFIDNVLRKSYRTLKRLNEPSWGEVSELIIGSKTDSRITLKIYDDRMGGKELLCEYSSTVEDLIAASEVGQESVKGSPQGDIFFTAQWKPLKVQGTFAYNAPITGPIGCAKITVNRAIVKSNLSGFGDIDPYFIVSLNKHIKYKSRHYSDTTKPVFNETVYVPIASESQHISVELYDYQSVGKDRKIGTLQVPLSQAMKRDNKGNYIDSSNSMYFENYTLRGPDGHSSNDIMELGVGFIPTLPVYSPDERAAIAELEKELKKKQDEFSKKQEELKKKMEKDPGNWEVAEVPDPFEEDEKKIHKKQKLSLEELLQHNSGLLTIQILSGSLGRDRGFLEGLVDDICYPSFVLKCRGDSVKPETNVVFIRDLKNSKLHFRVSRKNIAKEPQDVISTDTFDTIKLLQSSYEQASLQCEF